jgi:hypothetical protein
MELKLRFGQPEPYDYDTIIDQFSGTSFKSFQTSSIPLVQFWKDTETLLNQLLKKLNLDLVETTLCFEYPTSPKKGKGKASMTDLMIITADAKVAIEAKFTEYTPKGSIELIRKWKNEGDVENRKLVLQYWKDLIEPFCDGMDDGALLNVEYQFLHRTASACKDTSQAIVVYQVFYDDETKEYLAAYIEKLKNYIKVINPKENLIFYLWEIEATQMIFQKKVVDNPFLIMKNQVVYSFGKQTLEKIN